MEFDSFVVSDVILSAKDYFIKEWAVLGISDTPALLGDSLFIAETRPSNMSLTQWNLVKRCKAEQVAALVTAATTELERWLSTLALI
jgi:hypothetical protein